MDTDFTIAEIKDLKDIVDIYNWAILNTTATFDIELKTVESHLSWFLEHDEQHPIIILRSADQVVGWGAISRWSLKSAYAGMGEVSVYVHPEFHGCGLGSKILVHLLQIGEEKGFRTLASQISDSAEVSLHLHRKHGFVDTGVLRQAGVKFGKVVDVLILQIFF